MEENKLDILTTELEKKTGFLLEIYHSDTYYNEHFKETIEEGYNILLAFNDMFGWALSYGMLFMPKNNKTIESTIEEFNKWYDKEGHLFSKRFDEVPYPSREKGTYDAEHINAYFESNCAIGAEMEKSINEYCGKQLNDGL